MKRQTKKLLLAASILFFVGLLAMFISFVRRGGRAEAFPYYWVYLGNIARDWVVGRLAFASEVRLSGGNGTAPSSGIIGEGTKLWVNFVQDEGPTLRVSTDEGATWSVPSPLGPNDAYQTAGVFARCTGVLHFLNIFRPGGERDSFLQYLRSENDGASWSVPRNLSEELSPGHRVTSPNIGCSENVLYISWVSWHRQSDGVEYPHIWFRRSTDGANTWGPPVRLSPEWTDLDYMISQLKRFHLRMAVSGESIYVAYADVREVPRRFRRREWTRMKNPNYAELEVFVKSSHDGGVSWGPDVCVSCDEIWNSDFPAIVADGQDVWVVWSDMRGSTGGNMRESIMFSVSHDGAQTFSAPQPVEDHKANSENPALLLSGNTLYLTWIEWRDAVPEIYLRKSDNRGITWGPLQRLTANLSDKYHPALAITDNYLHILWGDNRDAPPEELLPEAYYKRLPLD